MHHFIILINLFDYRLTLMELVRCKFYLRFEFVRQCQFVRYKIYALSIANGYFVLLCYYNALKLFIITNMDKTFNFFKSKLKK